GVARVVVAVAALLGHEPLDEALEIVDQRALELVDEQRAGGVQGVDEGDAVGDRKLLDRLPDVLGDVGDLAALIGGQRERGVEDLHFRVFRGADLLGSPASPAGNADTTRYDTVTFTRLSNIATGPFFGSAATRCGDPAGRAGHRRESSDQARSERSRRPGRPRTTGSSTGSSG